MKCQQVCEHLSAYIDGALAEPLRRAVEEHVNACPRCAAELEGLRRTVKLVASLQKAEPPVTFSRDLRAALRARARRGARGAGAFRTGLGGLRWAPVAAIAIVAVLVGVGLNSMVGTSLKSPAAGPPGVTAEYGREAGRSGEPAAAGGASDSKLAAAPTQPDSSQGGGALAPAVPPLPGEYPATGGLPAYITHKVIKNGDLAVRVADVQDAYRRVSFVVDGAQGYVEQSSVWTGEEPVPVEKMNEAAVKTAMLVVRVPGNAFTRVMDEIGKLGRVVRRSESGQDVTQEYVDTDSRVRNLQRQEARLLEIMSKAATVDEILRVENELSRVRGEIEMLQGRLRYLDSLVAMSTIQVSLEQEQGVPPLPGGGHLGERMWRAFLLTGRAIANFFYALAVFLAGSVPVLVVLAIVAGLVWWGVRSRRRRA